MVVLELCSLQTEYDSLSLISSTRRTGLLLGTRNQAETLLVRSTSNDAVSLTNLEQIVYDRFQECMDNVERAMLDPAIAKKRAPGHEHLLPRHQAGDWLHRAGRQDPPRSLGPLYQEGLALRQRRAARAPEYGEGRGQALGGGRGRRTL